MRHVRLIIRRDSNTIHNRTCVEWEVPMLEYLFGEDGQIEVTDDYVPAPGEYPDPKAEFQRLVTAYGADRKSGISHAQTVFGPGHQGVKALKEAIAKARVAEMDAKPKRRPRQPVYRGLTDPMLA